MLGLATFSGLLLALFIGTVRRPAVAFAGVLCLYGLKQWGQDTSAFLAEHRTIANWSVAILVAIGLATVRGRDPQRPALGLPMPWVCGVVLYFYAFGTLAWSPDPKVALAQWAAQSPYILIVAICAPFLLQGTQDVKRMCDWTVIIGTLLCGLALLFGHWGARGLLVNGDLTAMETDPLAIAGLGGTICVAAALALPGAPWHKKLLYAVAVPVGIAAILRSGSRGQLLAAGVALLVGWPLISSRRNLSTWATLAVLALILNLIGAWLFQQLGVDSERWTGMQSQEDVSGRLALAVALLRHAISSPASLLFGLSNSSSFFYIQIYPHIAPLEVLGEEGLVGAAIYLCMVASTLQSILTIKASIRAHAERGRADVSAGYALGVLTALFLFEFVLTLKQGTLLSSAYAIAYAAMLGRMAAWQPAATSAVAAPVAVAPAPPFPNLMR
jgi:hypothetical protein